MQINSLDRNFKKSLKTLEETLRSIIAQNKTKIIPATKGRINKLTDRYTIQREKLENKKLPKYSQFEVCMGVIKVC